MQIVVVVALVVVMSATRDGHTGTATTGTPIGRGFVFGGPAHSARGPDGVLHDAWPHTAALSSTRRKFDHPAVPVIVDQLRRGDVWLVVRERVAGPTLRRIVDATVHQGARLEPAWALAMILPIAEVLAAAPRARLVARVGPDAVIVDLSGQSRFVGFEHWAPVTPLQPTLARTAFTVPGDDSKGHQPGFGLRPATTGILQRGFFFGVGGSYNGLKLLGLMGPLGGDDVMLDVCTVVVAVSDSVVDGGGGGLGQPSEGLGHGRQGGGGGVVVDVRGDGSRHECAAAGGDGGPLRHGRRRIGEVRRELV